MSRIFPSFFIFKGYETGYVLWGVYIYFDPSCRRRLLHPRWEGKKYFCCDSDYLFFFPLTGFDEDLCATFSAGVAARFVCLGTDLFGLDFSGVFGCGGATVTAAGDDRTATFPFFPAFGPGFAGAPAAGASAEALAARPRLGAGGGGGGGGANGFRNFSVSVRERSFPSSRSMKTSCASFG
jgi:hypothetical protein